MRYCEYSIYDALQAGFGRVVFVIKEEMEATFRERVGHTVERYCETAYVFQRLEDLPPGFEAPPQRQKPWGTAHATLICQHAVHTPFAVINADDFYGRSAFQALCNHLRQAQDRGGPQDYCMVGYRLEDTLSEHGSVARGVCTVSPDGYLAEIHERTRIERFGEVAKYTQDGRTWIEIPRGSTVSMNMWGFTPSLFAEMETRFPQFLQQSRDDPVGAEFPLPEVVGSLIREKRAAVRVLPAQEPWLGITYRQDKPRVEQAIADLIRRGIYPQSLWAEARSWC